MITPAYAPTATERVLPRLALDFTTASLDARVTVTRALNTATAINSSGVIAAVNANLPRFDYDPVALTCKGLLIEEARTNLQTYSETFSSWPTLSGASAPNATAANPLGGTTVSKLTEDSSSGGHVIGSANITVSSGATVTLSVYAKPAGRNWIAVYDSRSTTGKYFDIANGVIGGNLVGAPVSASITPGPNGYYRCSITVTAPATIVTPQVWLASANNTFSYQGNGTSGAYLSAFQTEVGAFATSYIPNLATGTTTRNADVVTMTGTNFSSWYNASEGTISCNVTLTSTPTTTAAFPRVLTIGGANPDTDEISIYTRTQGVGVNFGLPFGGITTAGVSQANLDGISSPINNWGAAIAYKANDCAAAGSGTLLGTDNSVTLPACTQLLIMGQARYQPQPSGWVRKINYWPQRLTNAEVQAFSKQE